MNSATDRVLSPAAAQAWSPARDTFPILREGTLMMRSKERSSESPATRRRYASRSLISTRSQKGTPTSRTQAIPSSFCSHQRNGASCKGSAINARLSLDLAPDGEMLNAAYYDEVSLIARLHSTKTCEIPITL